MLGIHRCTVVDRTKERKKERRQMRCGAERGSRLVIEGSEFGVLGLSLIGILDFFGFGTHLGVPLAPPRDRH